MIVVVEGPSGAGKTTWCRTHGRSYALFEELPDHATVPSEPEAQARFWVERNVARWRQVMERERRDSLVVVDTDPFKLHYVWTLWRTGQAPQQEWDLQREASREAFSAGRYALADLYLVSDIARSTASSSERPLGLPDQGLTQDLLTIGARRVRSGAARFDALLNALS